jgi:hypothetical protein
LLFFFIPSEAHHAGHFHPISIHADEILVAVWAREVNNFPGSISWTFVARGCRGRVIIVVVDIVVTALNFFDEPTGIRVDVEVEAFFALRVVADSVFTFPAISKLYEVHSVDNFYHLPIRITRFSYWNPFKIFNAIANNITDIDLIFIFIFILCICCIDH